MSSLSSLGLAALLGGLLAGCASAPPAAPKPPVIPVRPAEPVAPQQPAPPPAPAPAAADVPKLTPPTPNKTVDELRRQAALRLVAANPDRTYMTDPPAILLAIPVLEIELYNNGAVKRINVLRKPGQAPESVQIAIDAVHRAAPFGDVSRLPEPHKFSETFLFDETLRFKPRTLD
ncbi:hypothetical protein SNE35_12985 [Paucibacter sp. R3-3]|uniref:TonB C-terminal domain-containing protein n=1 Tax=Roseateles agri TaxID=3098619 RepID=A0ABU5DGL0_9BURK|nr:hypothetical protein [Paucibacter sp. R3-3]